MTSNSTKIHPCTAPLAFLACLLIATAALIRAAWNTCQSRDYRIDLGLVSRWIQENYAKSGLPYRQFNSSDFISASRINQPHSLNFAPSSFILLLFLAFVAIVVSLNNLAARSNAVGISSKRQMHVIVGAAVPLCLTAWIAPFLAISFILFYAILVNDMPVVFLTEIGASRRTLFLLSISLMGLFPLVFLHIRWRLDAMLAAGWGGAPVRCHRCGYPLDALPRCPECGTDRGANPTGRLSRGRRRVLIAGYSAVPVILIAPFWLSWIEMGVDRLLS